MSAPRRSARLASKSTNQAVVAQPTLVVAVVSQPATAAVAFATAVSVATAAAAAPATAAAPAPATAACAAVPATAATAVPTNSASTKTMEIVRTIQKFLDYMINTRGIVKIRLVIEMFEFIDKNFEFMNTVEFQDSKRFVLVIHDKTIKLVQEIDQYLEADPESSCQDYNVYVSDVYMQAKKLLQRVHTKCHLYGMDKFVIAEPIYKKFLDTYMEKFLYTLIKNTI